MDPKPVPNNPATKIMLSKAFLIGAVSGFIYSLSGYGSFLLWNYYETTLRVPLTSTSAPDLIAFFVGLPNLLIALLFLPGTFVLDQLKNVGLPVFSTSVPFPYYKPISIFGVILGIVALTIIGGLLGLLIKRVVSIAKTNSKGISWKTIIVAVIIGGILFWGGGYLAKTV